MTPWIENNPGISSLRSKPRRWLVTGAAGFIGSNLVEWLLKLNQEVWGLDNLATGHLKNLETVRMLVTPEQWARFHWTEGDIRSLETCRQACRQVQHVLHQAALGSVPRSIADPIACHDSNISGFLNMLVAARDQGVESFVYATSSSVYGSLAELPKVEDRIGRPLSPYALSKQVNELYAGVFGRVYDFQSIGLRYFNVYGPRQDPSGAYAAVIPTWFASVLQGEAVFINGDGETSRDFCFVEDAVQANLLAALSESCEAQRQIYNVAYGQSTTLNQLFEMIVDCLRQAGRNVGHPRPSYSDFRAGDVRASLADTSKAERLLGFVPRYPIQHGLAKAADWYLSSYSCQK